MLRQELVRFPEPTDREVVRVCSLACRRLWVDRPRLTLAWMQNRKDGYSSRVYRRRKPAVTRGVGPNVEQARRN
jgi:hypothetical protein